MTDSQTPADVAALDQTKAVVRDTVNDAARTAAYYTTLRAAGLPQALSNTLTAEYHRYIFHCCDLEDDE